MLKNYKQFNESKEDELMKIYKELSTQKIRSGISYNTKFLDGGHFRIFSINIYGLKVECIIDQDYGDYQIRIDNKESVFELTKELYVILRELNINYNNLIHLIVLKLSEEKNIPNTKPVYDEVIERIEEFEVIKNGQLDMISLNSLFDFYELSFDIHKLGRYITYGIKY